ncbi:MAG: hypothetical protein V2I39_03350 [Erythrobacter sp.]|jgi:hypothetical protein|nr:hypothetical protein [Erythrobacter sp.]
MTIHFAAAHGTASAPACAPIARGLVRRARDRAANDNAAPAPAGALPRARRTAPSEDVLRAALRHFAEHGLGAARAARLRAETAFFAGDRAGYDWWLEITRTLDRRLALEISGGIGGDT